MVPRRREPESRRRLSLAALLSLVFHAIAFPLLVWLLFSHVPIIPPAQKPERVSLSTVARIERTNRPLPPNIQKPVVQQITQPKPEPSSRPPSRELAKQSPNAQSQPPKAAKHPSTGSSLAEQEALFAKVAQRLHAENNPLSVATPNGPPAATQKQFINEMGQTHQTTYFAILTPEKTWNDGDKHCYYVSYAMQTNTGGEEDGDIPWPLCYPKNHDPMLPRDRQHYLPVPFPQDGYKAPPGTYMARFLKSIYDGHPEP